MVDETGLLLVLGLGTTAGIVAMALALLPAAAAGRRAHPVPARLAPPGGAQGARPVGLDVGYVIANQVAAQTVNVLAEPGSGDVTNYNVAFMFFQLPHGLLAVSLMTTFQPDLARAAVHRDWTLFNERLLLGLRLLSLVVVPAAIGYLVLALCRRRGGRGERRARRRRHAVDRPHPRRLRPRPHRLLGLPVRAAGLLRAAGHPTPFFLNCVENALNIVLAVVLVRSFGVVGLAVAYAIAYSVVGGGSRSSS